MLRVRAVGRRLPPAAFASGSETPDAALTINLSGRVLRRESACARKIRRGFLPLTAVMAPLVGIPPMRLGRGGVT